MKWYKIFSHNNLNLLMSADIHTFSSYLGAFITCQWFCCEVHFEFHIYFLDIFWWCVKLLHMSLFCSVLLKHINYKSTKINAPRGVAVPWGEDPAFPRLCMLMWLWAVALIMGVMAFSGATGHRYQHVSWPYQAHWPSHSPQCLHAPQASTQSQLVTHATHISMTSWDRRSQGHH